MMSLLLNVCVDALCPSQQFYSHVRRFSGRLREDRKTQYKAEDSLAPRP